MTRRAVTAWCAAVVLAALGAAAPAQDRTPISPFRLVDWYGKLFVNAHYRQDDQERTGGASSSDTDQFFEEGVELNGRGYVYHPNLMDWNISLRVGLTQQTIDTTNDSLNSDGQLLGYDINALLLKEKPLSIRLFGSMVDQFVNRTFARPLDLSQRTEGFELITKGDVPMSLLFEHTDVTESSNVRDDVKETYFVQYRVTDKRDRDWLSELTAEHEQTDEQLTFFNPGGGPPISQSVPGTRDEINFSNRWQFGPEALKHQLLGSARLLRRTGFFENDYYMVNQRLELRHDPTLSTFYVGSVSDNQTLQQSEQSFSGEAGIRKRIYKSLDLTARAYGTNTTYNDGSEDIYGGAFDAAYRKQTPIGQYSSTLHLAREYETSQFASGTFRVIDETVIMSVTTWQRLNRPNVAAGSVVVTNLANVPYIEGFDYDLRTIGSFTEVCIHLPVGGIADGDTVLVDYTVDESPDAQFHTDEIGWTHRFDFKSIPLSIYTEYRIRDDKLDSGSDPGNLDQRVQFLGGAELRLGALQLIAEYEQLQQELSPPWSAYRGRLNYTQALGRDASAHFDAHYEMLRYRDADKFGLAPGRDYLESFGASADFTTRVQQNLLLRLEGEYLETRGQDNETLLRIGPAVTWQYGLTEISISGYHQIYQQEDRKGTTQYVSFSFTRRF